MEVIEPGHIFDLAPLDGDKPERLTFVMRTGENYPGNKQKHQGTNIQEVIRALISRVKYLNAQKPHVTNECCIIYLRLMLYNLELRAAEMHKRTPDFDPYEIELLPVCHRCGHISCAGNCFNHIGESSNDI